VRGRDRRTGYYVAGRDWPAIPDDLSTPDMYDALEKIDDDDVRAAQTTLLTNPARADQRTEEKPDSGAEDPDGEGGAG
jgi:hypothetical protein